MDAVATGLVALAAAIVGGATEHLLSGARERRSRVEAALLELVIVLPIAVTSVSSAVKPRNSFDPNQQWHPGRERALQLLTTIRVQSRAFRGAKEIRHAADDVSARFGAAWERLRRDDPISPADTTNIELGPLMDATFGNRDLDRKRQWYEDHGFASGSAPD